MLLTKRGQSSSFWKTFLLPWFLLLQSEECLKAGAEGLMSPSRTAREVLPRPNLSVIGLKPRLLTGRDEVEDVAQKPERGNRVVVVVKVSWKVKYGD